MSGWVVIRALLIGLSVGLWPNGIVGQTAGTPTSTPTSSPTTSTPTVSPSISPSMSPTHSPTQGQCNERVDNIGSNCFLGGTCRGACQAFDGATNPLFQNFTNTPGFMRYVCPLISNCDTTCSVAVNFVREPEISRFTCTDVCNEAAMDCLGRSSDGVSLPIDDPNAIRVDLCGNVHSVSGTQSAPIDLSRCSAAFRDGDGQNDDICHCGIRTPSPTSAPTVRPTISPSVAPTTSSPTSSPTTSAPSTSPTQAPTQSPTLSPTNAPTTSAPTLNPTISPTTSSPTISPTFSPTKTPTASPTPFTPFAPSSSVPIDACHVTERGRCITNVRDRSTYRNNERCSFRVNNDVTLQVVSGQFETELGEDFLSIGNLIFSGSGDQSSPNGQFVQKDTEILWTSNDAEFNFGGFTICTNASAIFVADFDNRGVNSVWFQENLTCASTAEQLISCETREFRLRHNALTEVRHGFFNDLAQLTILRLSYNHIAQIETGSFDNNTNLDILEIASNQLIAFPLSDLRNLKQLVLDNNDISSIASNETLGLVGLTTLSIENNSLASFGGIRSITTLQILNFAGNALGGGLARTLRTTREHTARTPDHDTSRVSRSQTRILDSGDFAQFTNLQTLSLRNTGLTSVRGSFSRISTLTDLHLGDNPIETIREDDFGNQPNLTQLRVSNCNLTSVNNFSFASVSAVRLLDLSNNDLTELPLEAFQDLTSVEVLNIEGNLLASFLGLQSTDFLNIGLGLAGTRLRAWPQRIVDERCFVDQGECAIQNQCSNRANCKSVYGVLSNCCSSLALCEECQKNATPALPVCVQCQDCSIDKPDALQEVYQPSAYFQISNEERSPCRLIEDGTCVERVNSSLFDQPCRIEVIQNTTLFLPLEFQGDNVNKGIRINQASPDCDNLPCADLLQDPLCSCLVSADEITRRTVLIGSHITWPGPDTGFLCGRPIHNDPPIEICALPGIVKEADFTYSIQDDPDAGTSPSRENRDITDDLNGVLTFGKVYNFKPRATEETRDTFFRNAIGVISYHIICSQPNVCGFFEINRTTGHIRVNASTPFNVTVNVTVSDSKLGYDVTPDRTENESGFESGSGSGEERSSSNNTPRALRNTKRQGDTLVLTTWTVRVQESDIKNIANGPKGRDCKGGEAQRVDGTRFDNTFTCQCPEGTDDNCNDITLIVIGVIGAFLVLMAIVILALLLRGRHVATDDDDDQLDATLVYNVAANEIGVVLSLTPTAAVESDGSSVIPVKREVSLIAGSLKEALKEALCKEVNFVEELELSKNNETLISVIDFVEAADFATATLTIRNAGISSNDDQMSARRLERKCVAILSNFQTREEVNKTFLKHKNNLPRKYQIGQIKSVRRHPVPRRMIRDDIKDNRALSEPLPLGDGHYGWWIKRSRLCLTDSPPTMQRVAVKIIPSDQSFESLDELQLANESLIFEAKIMALLGTHTNVVKLLGIVQEPNIELLFLVAEFCHEARTLKDFVSKNNIPFEALLTCCLQTAAGLGHLSRNHVVHRDVKAQNVLVSWTPSKLYSIVCKVANFGEAAVLRESLQGPVTDYTLVVDHKRADWWRWAAIEVLQSSKYSTFSDVWAFGVLICEVVGRQDLPWPDVEPDCDFVKTHATRMCDDPTYRNPWPLNEVHTHVYDYVVKPCWRETPSTRPTFEVLQSRLSRIGAWQDVDIAKTMCDLDAAVNTPSQEETQPRGFLDAMSDWSSQPLVKRFSILISLAFYYFDFGTDVDVIVNLMSFKTSSNSTPMDDEGENNKRKAGVAAYIMIGILCLGPTLVTMIDWSTQPLRNTKFPKLLGFVLNFSNTRPLYFALPVLLQRKAIGNVASVLHSAKFFETLVEALPQLYVQSMSLSEGLITFDAVITSITISMINIAFACTNQAMAMYGWSVLDDRSKLRSLLTAAGTLAYFVADSGSRATIVFLLVAKGGISFSSVGVWLVAWFFVDAFVIRSLVVALANKDAIMRREHVNWAQSPRDRWWTIDPSIASSISGLLTAMPLSTNPAERRWLFFSSAVVIAIGGSQAIDENKGTGLDTDAAALFVASCVAKVFIYVLAELFLFASLDEGYKGLTSNYGFQMFVWSDDDSQAQLSRKKTDWVAWYDEVTAEAIKHKEIFTAVNPHLREAAEDRTNAFSRHLHKAEDFGKVRIPTSLNWEKAEDFEQVRIRFEGLHTWLKQLDANDRRDRHLLKGGTETAVSVNRVLKSKKSRIQHAKVAIELRRKQRNFITKIDSQDWAFGSPGYSWLKGVDWSDHLESAPAKGLTVILASLPIAELRFCSLDRIFETDEDADIAISAIAKGLEMSNFSKGLVDTDFQVKQFRKFNQKLHMSSSRVRWPVGASAIGKMLAVNQTITFVDLSENPIGPNGGIVIAEALRHNDTIVDLNLEDTNLGYVGGVAIAKALKENKTVTNVNLLNNGIGGEYNLGGAALEDIFPTNVSIIEFKFETQNLLTEECKSRIKESLRRNVEKYNQAVQVGKPTRFRGKNRVSEV